MSKPLTPEQLVRASWLTELRRQGDRKCTGTYANGTGRVCALGLLSEIAYGEVRWMHEHTLASKAGLNRMQAASVVIMNDGSNNSAFPESKCLQHTFAEIADVVEGWFK